jgi:O-succinylbenzoic acid--CoA ligase
VGVSATVGLAAAADRWAAERPEDPAIIDGASTWTWRDLAAWASVIAATLADRPTPAAGVSPGGDPGSGDRGPLVAVEPPMTASGVAMLHAVARAGIRAVLVPPRWTAEQQARLVGRSGACLFLHARGHADPVPSGGGLRVIDVHDLAPRGPAEAVDRPDGELIVPTSGTTAEPRLARLPLSAVDASAGAWRTVLPPATGWLLSLGLAHVAGIGIVARAAAEGVPVIVPAAREDLAASLGRPRVSHASLVATQLGRLLDATGDAPPPPGLACLLLGGGPIPRGLLLRALDAGWPAWPSYGQTETASGIVAADPARARAHPHQAGRALPGVTLRLREVGSGGTGELEVRGPMTFAGYLDDPAATAAHRSSDGWLRTGDLATLTADGGVGIIERLDDVLIVGGENVAPASLEAVLADLPGVREAAVVGVPDPDWGEVPVAVVVPRAGDDPEDAALFDALAARVPGVARPRRILRSAGLPRGGAEKLLRRALRDPAAAAVAVRLPAPGDRGPTLAPRIVLADDGQPLLVRAAPALRGDPRPALLLLHATLSSGAQLLRLAAELAPHGRVLLLDRRGSGGSRMAVAAPVDVARHVADAAQVLAACGERDAIVVGHSFGGVVALELAARDPGLVRAVAAWEPPYLPLAAEADRDALLRVAGLVRRAHAARGPAGAARVFMDIVSPGAWDRLRSAQREALEAEGDGVLADAAMPDLDAESLRAIRVPVRLGTGDASEPVYAPITAALATRIPGATVTVLPGLRHFAPIVTPGPVADLVRTLLPPASTPSPPTQEPIP